MSIVKERFILSGACVRYDPELLVSKRVIFFWNLVRQHGFLNNFDIPVKSSY